MNRRRRWMIVLVGALATLPLTFFLADAADAAVLASGKSPNWSGYVMQGSAFTSASGAWTVPAVASSTERQGDATWVGIGGVGTNDLIQVGTRAFSAEGRVAYEAWYEVLPAVSTSIPLAVHAGDRVAASLTEVAPNQWLVAIANQTTGATYTDLIHYASSHTSAEWIEELPRATDGPLALAAFDPLTFSAMAAIDAAAARAPETARPFTMVDRRGRPMATPSILAGATFVITRN